MTARNAQIVPFPERRRDGELWEPWVDEGVVARHFGVSGRTVRRWGRLGLPSRKVGGARRFRLSVVEAWHDARETA